MSKQFKIEGDDISDGYHTFDELYNHRCLLFLNLCLAYRQQCVWKPDPRTPGWFILYWESVNGQISYHLPDVFLPYVERAVRCDTEHVWDEHDSETVINRLEDNARATQP